MTDFPKRGHIYWVNLAPTIGSEIKKTRPGIIISNDIGNEVSSRVIVAPVTSKTEKVYPFETEISIENRRGKAMLDQIRAIDKKRLGKKIGELSETEMKHIDKALKTALDLD